MQELQFLQPLLPTRASQGGSPAHPEAQSVRRSRFIPSLATCAPTSVAAGAQRTLLALKRGAPLRYNEWRWGGRPTL
jgi:hypothetical protein